jgi:transposase
MRRKSAGMDRQVLRDWVIRYNGHGLDGLPDRWGNGRPRRLNAQETIAEDEHVAMILDQAGWHGANGLAVPATITLVPLPLYTPELNPAERVWLYLKERFLSHRLLDGYDAIADAACKAWNRLTAETGRIKTLCSYPWLPKVGT